HYRFVMIKPFNSKLTYEKEITFAICIPQSSRLDWSGRLSLRHLSGAGGSWYIVQCVAPNQAASATFPRQISGRGEVLPSLFGARCGRAKRPVFASGQ